MSQDPKKNEHKNIELEDRQLENVAGGDLGPDPTDKVMPPRPPKHPSDLPASEAPD